MEYTVAVASWHGGRREQSPLNFSLLKKISENFLPKIYKKKMGLKIPHFGEI